MIGHTAWHKNEDVQREGCVTSMSYTTECHTQKTKQVCQHDTLCLNYVKYNGVYTTRLLINRVWHKNCKCIVEA